MKMKSGLRVVGALALGAVAFAGTPLVSPVSAQVERTECRCVDRDGNDVEDCTCFRSPRIEGLLSQLATRPSGPRLGISVDAGQSARRDADGVLITDVLGDGPAEDAGLRDGDVVTAIDGQRLTESIGARAEEDFDLDQSVPVQRLLALVEGLEEGQEVEVEYLRDGQHQTTVVRAEVLDAWTGPAVLGRNWDVDRFRDQMSSLRERARDHRLTFPGQDRGTVRLRTGVAPDVLTFFGSGFGGSRAGVTLAEMNDGLGAYFEVDEGVLVLEADRRTGLGLRAGDVVVRIGGRAVRSPEQFHRIVASYDDDEDIEMTVVRAGDEVEVIGRLRY